MARGCAGRAGRGGRRGTTPGCVGGRREAWQREGREAQAEGSATVSSMAPAGPMVVDKFGGSVLTRPEDVAAAVDVVVRQRAAGLRPVVVVSAFEGVTDAI